MQRKPLASHHRHGPNEYLWVLRKWEDIDGEYGACQREEKFVAYLPEPYSQTKLRFDFECNVETDRPGITLELSDGPAVLPEVLGTIALTAYCRGDGKEITIPRPVNYEAGSSVNIPLDSKSLFGSITPKSGGFKNGSSLALRFIFDAKKNKVYELSSSMEKLFNEGLFSDVKLIANDKVVIKASRSILAIQSETFKGLFLSEESNSEFELDFDSETLKVMVKFMYTGRVEKNEDFTPKLLAATTFFKVNDLLTLIEERTIQIITTTNASELLTFAQEQGFKKLQSKCVEHIRTTNSDNAYWASLSVDRKRKLQS